MCGFHRKIYFRTRILGETFSSGGRSSDLVPRNPRSYSSPHVIKRLANWAMDDTYRSKSKVRRHVEIVFRNMRQDSQNQLRQMLSWIAIFRHFGGMLRDVHGAYD